MGARVDIRGLDPLVTKLKGFKGLLNPALARAQATIRRSLVSQLTVYPPPISATYVRTYQLQRGWERAVPIMRSDGATMNLINSVSYAGYVQGEDQAKVHQGRWQTVQEIADDNSEAAMQAFEDAAQRACDKI